MLRIVARVGTWVEAARLAGKVGGGQSFTKRAGDGSYLVMVRRCDSVSISEQREQRRDKPDGA